MYLIRNNFLELPKASRIHLPIVYKLLTDFVQRIFRVFPTFLIISSDAQCARIFLVVVEASCTISLAGR